MSDTRIAYGANCVWWDTIDKASRHLTGSGLPCCPHCQGVLFEVETSDEWWRMVAAYETDGNPGYRELMTWLQGKCFRTLTGAQNAFDAEQGQDR